MLRRLRKAEETRMASPVTVTDTSFKAEALDAPVPVLVDF